MEYDGSARSSGAARIPIQFVADSASSSRNKQLEGHEPRPTRYRQHYVRQQQQQQQRATTSARDNRASSINGRMSSPPPPRPSLPGRHMADSAETLLRDWDPGLRSRTDTTPLTVACRSDRGRDRRSRQRTRPADERPTRGRAESDSGRTASAGVADSLRQRLVTSSTGGGPSSGDDSGDDDSIISQTRSTSTRSPGQITSPHSDQLYTFCDRDTCSAATLTSSYCFTGVCLRVDLHKNYLKTTVQK